MKSSPFSKDLRKTQTDAEALLWSKIRSRQLIQTKFRRQHPIPPYTVDFISAEKKLIIELDGGDHNKNEAKIYDKKRTEFLENKGYRVIRFWNSDILKNINGVMEVIYFNLSYPHPNPLPTSRAREIKE
ncbi:MAG TPA: endonuclease domain-containing protein [Candidatus Eisenbacteria bacterium]|nr:endonuclease domain-containing protein [Candidatus Eisenbacteria bacterium]